MISLNKFYEVIEIDGQTLGPNYKAYRMDSGRNKPDMRKCLGLGSCHSCDYFFISKHIVLIEDKRFLDKEGEIKREVSYLKADDKEDYALKEIVRILHLKVYGSLLMLSRLALQCEEFSEGKTKYDFWFVDSSLVGGDIKYFQHIQSKLIDRLESTLTKNFIGEIAIMQIEGFKQRLDKCKASKP